MLHASSTDPEDTVTVHTVRALSLVPATLLASALLSACGGGGGRQCLGDLSLETSTTGTNSNEGIVFDVQAITDIEIRSFDVKLEVEAEAYAVDVYDRSGTWVGYDGSSDGWRYLGSSSAIVSAGEGVATEIPLQFSIRVAAGDRHAFFITTAADVNYSDGTAVGTLAAGDENLEIYEGAGIDELFAGTFTPRVFNGTVHYRTCD